MQDPIPYRIMLMVRESCVHVLREIYEQLVLEDSASPDAAWKVAGWDTILAPTRIMHGFSPVWFETPSVGDRMYGMHAKDIDWGNLRMEPEYEVRLRKGDNVVLLQDIFVASGLTATFIQAQNSIKKMLLGKDPVIMSYTSIKLEQTVFKVCARLIHIIVPGINCYVLYYNGAQCCRMTFESS